MNIKLIDSIYVFNGSLWATIFIFMITSCGFIEIAPRHKEMYQPEVEEYSFEGLVLMEVNYADIDSMIGSRQLYLWAPWCVHCLVQLDQMNQNPSDGILMISTSYDIKGMHKVLSKRPNLMHDTLYVLDAANYGVTERERILKFGRELGVDSLKGVPHTFYKIEGKWELVK